MSSNNHTNDIPLDDLVYAQLKTLANKLMNDERQNHTLSPTDLVHEAYVKLSDGQLSFEGQRHYFRTLARQMRRLLINSARSKSALKNGGKDKQIVYTESLGLVDNAADFSNINAAIKALELLDNESAEAIDLVYFAALPQIQAADCLDVSLATLERNLRFGRTFISEYINNLGE